MKRFTVDSTTRQDSAGQLQKPAAFLVSLRTVYLLEATLEWRNRGRTAAVAAFAVVLSVIYHYAMDPAFARSSHNLMGSALTTLFFASILLTGWSSDVADAGAFRILSLAPLDAGAIFVGRSLARWLILNLLILVYVPTNHLLLTGQPPAASHFVAECLLLSSTALSLASLGTLFNSMLSSRARGILLPVLLLPASVPVLVLASGALDAQADTTDWVAAFSMLAPGILYCSLGSILFPFLNDEGPFSL